jgi:hypothetical protein
MPPPQSSGLKSTWIQPLPIALACPSSRTDQSCAMLLEPVADNPPTHHPHHPYDDRMAKRGEINVRLLHPEALPALARYAETVEWRGKHRYNVPRPCYPPGEVASHFHPSDPRSSLLTDVNMTAVCSGHMTAAAAAVAEQANEANRAGRGSGRRAGKRAVNGVQRPSSPSSAPCSTAYDSSPVQWIYHRWAEAQTLPPHPTCTRTRTQLYTLSTI